MGRLSAWLAIAFGAAVAVAQIARNWDNLDHWPTWAIDELAAAVLIVSGVRALQGKPTRALMVGWSFACGLYLSGFASHAVRAQYFAGGLLLAAIVGVMFAVSVAGLALILMDRKATGNEKRPA